tara:strand:+ start:922 stop:1308 length:387 start_codon:yes stop_codon:yes gene_type:complete
MKEWIVFVLAVIGLLISVYIFEKRRKKQHLVCLIGKECDVVLGSKYNKLFGIHNEIVGMFYYFVIGLLALLLVFGIGDLTWVLLVISFVGVLFSIYFLYIQFIVLKAGCDYCVGSALVSFLIFLIEVF